MPNTTDYLPVATATGAYVDTQSNFSGSSYQELGFTAGIAQPNQANKIWRQASMVGNAITQFIANQLGINIYDDGNSAGLLTNLIAAIKGAALSANSLVVVAYSATPVFDASQGTKFQITLTGPCAPTLINTTPGQTIRVFIIQDGVGGRTFTPPGNLPLDTAGLNTAANVVNTQGFEVYNNGTANGALIAVTALMTP